MIDLEELQEIIEKSYLDDSNISLYLFENKGTKREPLSIYILNIDKNIVEQIRSLSKEYMSSIVDLIQNDLLHDIPIYNPDNEQNIFKIASQQVEMFQEMDKYISGEKSYHLYKKDDIREDKLKAWIFRVETAIDGNIEQILFFQRFQSGKMLGSKWIAIFQHDKEFKLLGNNVLNFNLTMDFVFYKNTFIVTKMSSFEKIFGYEEFYKNNASELVNELNENRIEGLNYNIQFVDINSINIKINESTRLAHKLYSARINGYFKKINYNKLVDLNTRYNLNLNLNDVKSEWTIDEQLDLQVMARILNDDYERSQLTDNEYIAVGKEEI